MKKLLFIFILIICIPFNVFSYNEKLHKKKLRIVVIQSYNINHFCGEPQQQGIIKALDEFKNYFDYDIYTIYLNTRTRNVTEYAKKEVSKLAYDQIIKYGPNLIFSLDDNAFKYLVIPYLITDGIEIVYSGLNKPIKEYVKEYPILKKFLGKTVFGKEEYFNFTKFVNLYKCNGNISNIIIFKDNTPTSTYLTNNWVHYFKEYDIYYKIYNIKTTYEIDKLFFNQFKDKHIILINTIQKIIDIKTADKLNKQKTIAYIHNKINRNNHIIQVCTNINSLKYNADLVVSIDFEEMGYYAAREYLLRKYFDKIENKKLTLKIILNGNFINNKYYKYPEINIKKECYKYIDGLKQ